MPIVVTTARPGATILGPCLNWIGNVANASQLPTTAGENDAYTTLDTHDVWVFSHGQWVNLGPLPGGPGGLPGANGINAFTIAGGFTVPAVGQTVTVTVDDASWIVVGQFVWVAGAGENGDAGAFKVVGVSDNTVTLLNPPSSVDISGLISSDPNNIIVQGTDSLLYAPEGAPAYVMADSLQEARQLSIADPDALIFYPQADCCNPGNTIWVAIKGYSPCPPVVTYLSFVINSGADAAFIVPTSNPSAAPYNWIINWGDGTASQTVSGTADPNNTAGIPHSYAAANTHYTITINPAGTETYGWLRGYGQNQTQSMGSQSSANKGKLLQFASNPKMLAFITSATALGDNCYAFLAHGCFNLTNALCENIVGAENATSIGDRFRSNQYRDCTSLVQAAPFEAIPAGVTSIGQLFRYNQHLNNAALVGPIPDEVMPAGVTVINDYFRCLTYSYCASLLKPVPEVLPAGVQAIGSYFRFGQYEVCTSLTEPAEEAMPANVSIGFCFRQQQYDQCAVLSRTAAEVLPGTSVNVWGDNFRDHQYASCPGLLIGNHIHSYHFATLVMTPPINPGSYNYGMVFGLQTAKPDADTVPRYYTDATQTATNPVTTLTPPNRLYYLANRTGIPGYASIHPNWK